MINIHFELNGQASIYRRERITHASQSGRDGSPLDRSVDGASSCFPAGINGFLIPHRIVRLHVGRSSSSQLYMFRWKTDRASRDFNSSLTRVHPISGRQMI